MSSHMRAKAREKVRDLAVSARKEAENISELRDIVYKLSKAVELLADVSSDYEAENLK